MQLQSKILILLLSLALALSACLFTGQPGNGVEPSPTETAPLLVATEQPPTVVVTQEPTRASHRNPIGSRAGIRPDLLPQ